MSQENAAKLDTIRALLAKAEATAGEFPAEAETYRAKAMQLLAKYGIDQALLDAEKPVKPVAGNRVYKVHAPYAKDKATLLGALVKVLGGRAVWMHKPKRVKQSYTELHVFATEADLARIDLLYTSLLVQCSNDMMRAAAGSYDAVVAPRRWKADFLYGFTNMVSFRLDMAERQAQHRAEEERRATNNARPSTDLVLASKAQQVDDAVTRFYPTLITKSTRRARSFSSGFEDGQSAGVRADLGMANKAKVLVN